MPVHLVKLDAAPDLVDRVYRSLLDAILDGSLAPGARLTQEEIARQLAVSRQPVLQALRQLKGDGLVLDAPGRGVLVTRLDGAWIASVYEVRAALDVLAARLAAQHRAVLAPDLIVRGRKALRSRNVRALIDADAAFHNAIYVASCNPSITQSAHVHWRHIRRAMGAVLQRSALRETVWDEHEAIAAAIAEGDSESAARLISGHDLRASEYISQQLGNASGEEDETQRRAARTV
jgi:DNA-binding GntR family transcriptional regulator